MYIHYIHTSALIYNVEHIALQTIYIISYIYDSYDSYIINIRLGLKLSNISCVFSIHHDFFRQRTEKHI